MTKMFLLGKQDKKRRGLILSGAANSGKSTLGRFVANIWTSHSLR
jgi:polynucleotide 5'-kinase involved in rRNA processing